MTSFDHWLEPAIVITTAFTVLTVGVTIVAPADGIGRRLLSSHHSRLDKDLRFLWSNIKAWQLIALEATLSFALLLVSIGLNQWIWMLLIPAFILGIEVCLKQLVNRRVASIERQVEPWINTVANALRASPSLGDAIASSATLLQPPISQELELLVKEYELGTPLDEALENLSERVGSPTLSATVQALKIARRSGGNLTELLQSSAESLREFARLEGVVRTKTAEGKAQVFVIGIIPLPMVLGIRCLDPRFFEPLFGSLLGQLLISAALVLWLAAILLARKILDVDI